MVERIIKVPSRIDLEHGVGFVSSFDALTENDEYVFDFSAMGWSDPAGMLYVSTGMKHLARRLPQATFYSRGHESKGYQAHMGFFQAFGLDHGNKPGQANGSHDYLPITELKIDDIYRSAIDGGVNVGEIVEEDAARLAALLSRTSSGDLFGAIKYSFRELLRNAVEHSKSDTVSYCAQHWPTKKRVQIAILDSGIGIRKSLERNPCLEITSDVDALKLAIMPGISGKMYPGVDVRPYDIWQNSGYGLYMTSRLCRNSGSFLITTNEGALSILKEKHETYSMKFLPGTAIRLAIKTDTIGGLSDRLKQFSREGREIAARNEGSQNIKPSAASLMLNSQSSL